jgi:hypothetical protein
MAHPRLEFTVDSVEPSGQVLGRNHDFDIPVGTTFVVIRKVRVDGDMMHLHTVDLGVIAPIALTLKAVELYGRSLDVIPGGYTAGLTLEGIGLDALTEAIRSAAEREYVLIAVS